MRADRLLSILLLLQLHGRMTARELAERLEVSERTIHRDMEALSAAGVPVTAERGSGGGWALMEGYETKLNGLNQAEVQALFVAQPRILQELGLSQAAEAARIRLMAALPAPVRRDAEFVRQRILVDGAPWREAEGEDLSALPVLQEAIWAERQVRMRYQKGEEEAPSERLVDPLGLVAKGRVWYLVAGIVGEVRTFRVSRIRQPEVMVAAAVRPEGFDLAEFWSRSTSEFVSALPRFAVTARVEGELLRHLRYKLRFAQVEEVGEVGEDGWATVRIRFQTEEEACEQLLGLGAGAELVEPAELRGRIRAAARAVVERYS